MTASILASKFNPFSRFGHICQKYSVGCSVLKDFLDSWLLEPFFKWFCQIEENENGWITERSYAIIYHEIIRSIGSIDPDEWVETVSTTIDLRVLSIPFIWCDLVVLSSFESLVYLTTQIASRIKEDISLQFGNLSI